MRSHVLTTRRISRGIGNHCRQAGRRSRREVGPATMEAGDCPGHHRSRAQRELSGIQWPEFSEPIALRRPMTYPKPPAGMATPTTEEVQAHQRGQGEQTEKKPIARGTSSQRVQVSALRNAIHLPPGCNLRKCCASKHLARTVVRTSSGMCAAPDHLRLALEHRRASTLNGGSRDVVHRRAFVDVRARPLGHRVDNGTGHFTPSDAPQGSWRISTACRSREKGGDGSWAS